jgi:hypothetical protein
VTDGLSGIARSIAATGEGCAVTSLLLEVLEDDTAPWVEFALGSSFGVLAGHIEFDYDEAQSLEGEELLDVEACGGTVDQLIYDILLKDGKEEEHGLRTGFVLGEQFYAVLPKKANDVQDEERVVFRDIDEALAYKREKSKRKTAALAKGR